MIKDEILNKAFEIGFNYEKFAYREKARVSLPCSAYLKNGEFYENTVLIFDENPNQQSTKIILNIEDIERIEKSEYALPHKFRTASINAEEYRNDWPFFLRTKQNKLLSYNAYEPIHFTYNKDVKATDIIETVDFYTAKKEGYEGVSNNFGPIALIFCGYDEALIEKIKKSYNEALQK